MNGLEQFYMWLMQEMRKRQRMQVPMSGAGVPMQMGEQLGRPMGQIPGINGQMNHGASPSRQPYNPQLWHSSGRG